MSCPHDIPAPSPLSVRQTHLVAAASQKLTSNSDDGSSCSVRSSSYRPVPQQRDRITTCALNSSLCLRRRRTSGLRRLEALELSERSWKPVRCKRPGTASRLAGLTERPLPGAWLTLESEGRGTVPDPLRKLNCRDRAPQRRRANRGSQVPGSSGAWRSAQARGILPGL